MFKKNIIFVLVVVFLLAMVSQYNRTDGFLHLMKNVNAFSFDKPADNKNFALPNIPDNAKDTFLIVYEDTNVRTTFLKNKIEQMIAQHKKTADFVNVKDFQAVNKNYSAILLAVNDFEGVNINLLRNYTKNGGTVIFMYKPALDNNFKSLAGDLGIAQLDDYVETYGFKILTDIMVGAKGYKNQSKDMTNLPYVVKLKDSVKVHMTSFEDIALLWEYNYGKGKFVFFNGTDLFSKMYTGVMAALLSKSQQAYIYPIIGTKLFFIDDFPSPEPEGVYDRIYDEFRLTTAQFYRQIWWPEMLGYAQLYGIKYTGLIIENYNDNVQPPFKPLGDGKARNNLVIYGRELLKSGGEIGIHGFNHQSLAPEGYGQKALGYNVWTSQDNMILALLELKRYVKDVYPQYTIRTYVPPSNILSPEGRDAVVKAFPEIKVFSSLYSHVGSYENERPYLQDFERLNDGTYNIPRVSSGFVMAEDDWWLDINVINAQGIFSHFVHPDEIYYKTSADLNWGKMSKGFKETLETVTNKYGWLKTVTASQATVFIDNYLDAEYSSVLKDNTLTVYCENVQATRTYYFLKAEQPIKSFKGCSIKKIGDSSYLLVFVDPVAVVEFESEATK